MALNVIGRLKLTTMIFIENEAFKNSRIRI
jgi:hypothetical protein